MHIPDGFLSTEVAAATGGRRGGHARLQPQARRRAARRPPRAARRRHRRVHLRRADAQLPRGGRHQRPPAGRRAGGDPARAVDRVPGDGGGDHDAGVRVRRRRRDRARRERPQHGRDRRARRRRADARDAPRAAEVARRAAWRSPAAAPGWRSCSARAATSVELGISGTVPLGTVLPAMLGVHALIGVGEAVITVAARQRGAGHAARPRRGRRPAPGRGAAGPPRRRGWRRHEAARRSRSLALALAVGLAAAVSPFASSSPGRARARRGRQGLRRATASCTRSRTTSPVARLRVPGHRRPAARHRAGRLRRHAARLRPRATGSPRCGRRRPGAGVSAVRNRTLELTGPAGDPASPVHRLDPRAKLLGFLADHVRGGLGAARRVAGLRRLRAGARRRWPRPPACRRRTIWRRARTVLLLVLFVAVFVPFVDRGGEEVALGPFMLSVAGLDGAGHGRRQGDDRHGQRRAARRDHELPGRAARARGAARAARAAR